jgi:hypothetical protein
MLANLIGEYYEMEEPYTTPLHLHCTPHVIPTFIISLLTAAAMSRTVRVCVRSNVQ